MGIWSNIKRGGKELENWRRGEKGEDEAEEESKKSFHVDSLLLSRSQKFLRRGGESGQRV